MATESSEEKPTGLKIKVFTGKDADWTEWKLKFQGVLRSKKLLKHLTTEEPTAESVGLASIEQQAAIEKWKDEDEALFFELIIHTSGVACKLVQQFQEGTEGNRAWKALTEKFEGSGSMETVELVEKLITHKMDGNKDPELFFMPMEDLQRRLRNRGKNYTDDMMKDLIIARLPRDKYHSLITSLSGEVGITYDRVKERIRIHWRTLIREEEAEEQDESSAKALMSKHHGAGEGNKQKVICFRCNKEGHKSFECQQRNNQGNGGGRGNRGGRHGSGGRGNRGRGFGAGRHQNNNHRGDWKKQQDNGGLKCYGCQGYGHKIQECTTNKKKQERRDGEGDAAKANSAIQEEEEVALTASMDHTSMLASGFKQKGTWIVDSGATTHMVNSKEGLTDVIWRKGRVIAAGGQVLESIGTGSVKAMISTKDGRTVETTIKNALIVPELRRNLLSVDRIMENGGNVLFRGPSNAVIVTQSGTELPLRKVGNLYELEYSGRSPNSGGKESTKEEQALNVSDEEQLWHARLGHRNMMDIKKLAGMDVGLPTSFKGVKEGSCDTCEVGKHTHTSFPSKGKEEGRRASFPMEIVHMDVFGPIDTASLGGAKYAILFTDEYSKWMTIYFMESKSEALDKVKEYLEDVTGLLRGCKVHRLHSDNGGEFISRDFKKYCKRKGVLRTYTDPRAPQQNGVAERSNRTVIEMARCLRLESGLDKGLWAEACKTAVYILNRVPSAVLDGQTPYFKLFGKQAKLDHLKVFGCMAYAHVYGNEKTKMDPKAWRGIMIGYDEHNRRCYRLYDPIRKVIRRSVHVTFDEYVFPARKEPDATVAKKNREIVDQEGIVEMEPPQVENPIAEKEKRRVRFNLLPAGSNLIPRDDTGNGEERRTVDEAQEQGINGNDGGANHENSEDSSEGHDPEDRTANENPYAREYNTSNRGGGNWRCQDEDCNIRGIHRAHLGVVHHAYQSAVEIMADPISYKEAIESEDSEKWKKAMEEEVQAHIKNGTWELVERPAGVNVIGSRWVFKTKRDENGKIDKYKGRGVAKGYSQKEGLDYGQVFAPTAKPTSIRTVVCVSALLDWELENMDVNTAFLNADVDEEIYMQQLEGFEQYGPNGEELVCKLKKSIYGLRQASRNWNLTIDQWMKGYGFQASVADACVYVKRQDQEIIVVVVWVDDLIIAGSSRRIVQDFKAAISKRFSMKDLGALKWILGVEIKRDRSRRRIEISQRAYINQMLERFGMADCKSVGAPAEGVLTRINAEEGGRPDRLYMSIVGSLIYAAMITRPDITYAVQALGRHLQTSGEEHMIAAKRVLRYLQGTKDLGLVYEASGDSTGQPSIVGFSDADWGGDLDTRRSTTGYLFMIDKTGGAISWASKLQPTVALSSAEAEYMAACAAVQEAIHLRLLMHDLGFEQKEATVIYEDNQGCIALSDNPVFHKRTKHIDIRYHFIRERVTSKEIELKYVATEHQLADLLTKGLPKPRVIALRRPILGY